MPGACAPSQAHGMISPDDSGGILKTDANQLLRATFLGTADGHTSASRQHSGILLETTDTSLLLDCGAAAAPFLLSGNYDTAVPGAIWLSHMHSDHIGQLSSLIQSLWLRERKAPLTFFGPAEVMRATKDWLARCLLFSELIGFPLVWQPVKPGRPVKYGPYTLTAFATDHLSSLADHFEYRYPHTCFECYGVTVQCHERRYVYSADLAHPRELAAALEGGKTDALLCELTHFPERELFREIAKYEVDSLLITHYPDTLMGEEKKLKLIAQEEKYTGSVLLMHDKVAQEL